jgi:hypothetical protein
MATHGLYWCLLISFGIHALLFLRFHFLPYEIKPLPIRIGLVTSSSLPDETDIRAEKSERSPALKPKGSTSARRPSSTPRSDIAPPPSSSTEDTGRTEPIAEGFATDSGGSAGIVAEPGGTGVGGGTSVGASGSSSSRTVGERTSAGTQGSAAGKDDSTTAETVAIPEAFQVTTSPYEGEVYTQVDFYVLYGSHSQQGVNVPGNQICKEGEQLRTRRRVAITETRTDLSKCRTRHYGDDVERVVCPSEALTKVVVFNGHLFSPITYSFNICLLYDKSNCYWQDRGDDQEREVCRPASRYSGIWAEGTMFQYSCARSKTESYSHPLRYNVRFMRDVEFPDDPPRMRTRLLHSQSRSIPPCDGK